MLYEFLTTNTLPHHTFSLGLYPLSFPQTLSLSLFHLCSVCITCLSMRLKKRRTKRLPLDSQTHASPTWQKHYRDSSITSRHQKPGSNPILASSFLRFLIHSIPLQRVYHRAHPLIRMDQRGRVSAARRPRVQPSTSGQADAET